GSERRLPAHARWVKPVDPHERIDVSIYLRDPAAQALEGDPTAHAQQPGQQMSRADYIALHSANPEDVRKVEHFAHQHTLTVTEVNPASRKMVLSGTLGHLMAAFATELHHYEHNGHTFRARSGYLHVPDDIAPLIEGVFGLDNRPQARAQIRIAGPAAGARAVGYTPPQLAHLYDFPSGLDGTGECIALIELGGGYNDQDLTTYFGQLGVPSPQVISV